MAIAGGGLAGLALAILSARAGYSTILFEKERYPFHKVCGEYVGFESWNFLQDLGLPLSDMQLPIIHRLMISSPAGKFLEQDLPLGGFGISRHTLDHMLVQQARREGVVIAEGCRVMDVIYRNNGFIIFSSLGETECRVAAAAFGRRSSLDAKWKREFLRQRPGKLNHYIAVKYHIRANHPADLLAMHNFAGGYCGTSRVDQDRCSLSYLSTAQNLRMHRNDVSEMEEKVLMKNPFIRDIFLQSSRLSREPLMLSRISFNKKTQVENHVLMLGDAAGMISPLFGNGISLALHSAKLAFDEIQEFMKGRINRFELEQQYTQQWERNFGRRMMAGRLFQRLSGSPSVPDPLVSALTPFPGLVKSLIRFTQGHPF